MRTLRPVLLLFVVPAILVYFAPAGTARLLLFNRTDILAGQWWRLWTGHWVHFSASHLIWDLVALGAAGVWLEHIRPGLLLRFTLIAAPLLSLVLLVLAPSMQAYGGLSGLGTGVVTLLALIHWGEADEDRVWWLGVLLLVAAKIGWDAGHDSALFSDFGNTGIRSSALAHATGVGLAAAFFVSLQTHSSLRFLSSLSASEPSSGESPR